MGVLPLSLLVAAVFVAAGCAMAPAPPTVPFPTISVPTLSPEQFAASRRFRGIYGLRADDPWIAVVSSAQSSREGVELFGVPLMPWEVERVMARTTTARHAATVVMEYGATVPGDWHGSYVDQDRGGIIVVEFYRDADRHRVALARLLLAATRFEVREVDRRILDQVAFVERVKGDRAWFRTIDAELLDVVTNPMDGGIVELTYLAERRDLDAHISEHFGAPEWLHVERAGAPPWTGPVGDLVILAVDRDGLPVPGLLCSLGAGTGLATGPDGICRYPAAAATEGHIELLGESEGSTYIAGAATFTVVANDVTVVRIVVAVP